MGPLIIYLGIKVIINTLRNENHRLGPLIIYLGIKVIINTLRNENHDYDY